MTHSIVEELTPEIIQAVFSEADPEIVAKVETTDDAIKHLLRIAEASGLDLCVAGWQDILGSKDFETHAALLTMLVIGWNCATNAQDLEKLRALLTSK